MKAVLCLTVAALIAMAAIYLVVSRVTGAMDDIHGIRVDLDLIRESLAPQPRVEFRPNRIPETLTTLL